MIDLHNHILPGLDDGAANVEESLAIARQFASEGVRALAATPHIDPLHGRGPTRETVIEQVRLVQESIDGAGIDLDVNVGSELFLTPDAPRLLNDGEAVTLANTRYVLVECSFQQRPLYLEDTLFRLQLAGYRPILAHPERYGFVHENSHVLDELIGRDVLMQVTAPSLLGEYGGKVQRLATTLVQTERIALAASDRHHAGSHRSLAAVHELVTRLCGAQMADRLLIQNPGRVLAGERIDQPEPRPLATRGRWSRLFRRPV